MCFEASAMASAARSLQSSSSFGADAIQFLISPREIKSFESKDEAREAREATGSIEESSLDLVDYDSLPEFLKHNEFVINYYRSEWPLKETILSIFSIHNETLNVWTHLIGFFIFLMLTGYAASIFPLPADGINSNPMMAQLRPGNSSSTFNPFFMTVYQNPNPITSQTSPITRWPFYIYLAGAMFCLLIVGLDRSNKPAGINLIQKQMENM